MGTTWSANCFARPASIPLQKIEAVLQLVIAQMSHWLADAWSTALMVLGVEQGLALCTAHDLPALFVMQTEQQLQLTPSLAWQRMLG
jgi:thiamine biosynthesis lipoprotein ApbE